MALLETFEILFRSNSQEIEDGAEQAERAVDDVEASLLQTDRAAENLGESFTDLIGRFSGAIAGLVGAGALVAATLDQVAATDALGKYSDALGLNIEEVGAWSEAAGRAGGSAEAFQGSIQGLQGSLQDMAIGGGGAASEALARLGISATDATGQMRGVFDLLPEIAGQFENLSQAQQIELGEKLGLDQGTIQLLQAGEKGVTELVKRQHELGVATAEDAKLAATFNDALDDAGQIFGHITRSIGIVLLPALTSILKGFEVVTKFVKENKDFVTAFFIAIAGTLTALYLPAILTAAAATIATIAPFIAIGAAVAAFAALIALAYDDIVNFIKGNDSLTGVIVGKVKTAFEQFTGWINGLLEPLREVVEYIEGKFSSAVSGITDTVSGISDFLGLGDGDKKITAALEDGRNAMQQARSNPVASDSPLAAGIISNANSVTQNTSVSVGRVNVDARGGDSDQIAKGVSGALKDQMQQTMSNFDDAVAI